MRVTNNEVLQAKQALQTFKGTVKMPIRTAIKLAELEVKLEEPLKVFSSVRDGLLEKHKCKFKNNNNGQLAILSILEEHKDYDYSDNVPDNVEAFVGEFNELLQTEIAELNISKVALPEKTAATCDKCGHNMDKTLEIDHTIIKDLLKFVTC